LIAYYLVHKIFISAQFKKELSMSNTTSKNANGASYSSSKFRLVSIKDIDNEPSYAWQVSDVLIANGLACIYGQSGTGKTFLALDLALSICNGKDWFGCTTLKAPVTYVYQESRQGIRKRLDAWKTHNQFHSIDNFHFITEQIDISNQDAIAKLIRSVNEEGKSKGVIVIDTLSASTSGIDENSSKDMGNVIFNLKKLSFDTQCLVILIHHTGKDETRGLRGHTSLFAAMDSIIKVSNGSWQIEKNKDGAKGQQEKFELTVIKLAQGESSCAVDSIFQSIKSQSGLGGNQKMILSKIESHFESIDVKYLSIEDAVAATFEVLPVKVRDKRKSVTRDIFEKLIEKRLLSAQVIQGVECILNPKYPVQNPSTPLGGEGVLDNSGHRMGYMGRLTYEDWRSQGVRH